MNKFVVYSHDEVQNEFISYGEGLTMPEAVALRDSHPVGLEIMSQESWNEVGETFIVYYVTDDGPLFKVAEMSTSAMARALIKGPHKFHDYTDCLIMPKSEWDKLPDTGDLEGYRKIAS